MEQVKTYMTIEEAEKIRGYSAGYVYSCTKQDEKLSNVGETFSRSLAAVMKHKGITFEQLLGITGFTDATVYGWLNGHACPSVKSLIILSDTLNVSIDYLLKGKRKREKAE